MTLSQKTRNGILEICSDLDHHIVDLLGSKGLASDGSLQTYWGQRNASRHVREVYLRLTDSNTDAIKIESVDWKHEVFRWTIVPLV